MKSFLIVSYFANNTYHLKRKSVSKLTQLGIKNLSSAIFFFFFTFHEEDSVVAKIWFEEGQGWGSGGVT